MAKKEDDKKKKRPSWGALLFSEAKRFAKTTKKELKEWSGDGFRYAAGTKKPKRFSKNKKRR